MESIAWKGSRIENAESEQFKVLLVTGKSISTLRLYLFPTFNWNKIEYSYKIMMWNYIEG